MADKKENLLASLQERLGHRFNDPALLLDALTHRSWCAERGGKFQPDNERLEFLGDAVLDLVIGALLFARYNRSREGELTSLRAALVNTRQLARIAEELGIGECLRLGRGEAAAGGRRKASLTGSAYEAIIGAVFIDGGYEAASKVVARHFGPWLDQAGELLASGESKNKLQEYLQARFGQAPDYVLEKEQGPDHCKTFTVVARFQGITLGTGTGRSKKDAEKKAATAALRAIGENDLFESGPGIPDLPDACDEPGD